MGLNGLLIHWSRLESLPGLPEIEAPATANVSTVVRDCPLQLAPAFHRSTRPGTATAEPQTIGFRHPATESPFVGVIV